jgi:hypothetical protein
MGYYDDYFINDQSLLFKKINQGKLHQDIRLGNNIIRISGIHQIFGHLSIDSDDFHTIEDLEFISSHLWCKSKNLKSLGSLKKIGGDVNLRHSGIEDLGMLHEVGGNLNLRDSSILNLGCLKYVGGNLILPKSKAHLIEGQNVIVNGKFKFFNDLKDSIVEKIKIDGNWAPPIFLSDIHNQEISSNKRQLTGEFLIKRCLLASELNQYSLRNFKEFSEFVDMCLSEWYGSKYSFYDVLFNEIATTSALNAQFTVAKYDKRKSDYHQIQRKLSDDFIKSKHPVVTKYTKKVSEYKKQYSVKSSLSNYWIRFDEHKLGLSSYTGQSKNAFIFFIENELTKVFKSFILEHENLFRESRGLPRIGEGWISETDLYYQLKKHFYKTTVIHHGKPKWLGRQHVDIWFSKWKIGIEYQGEQHDKPIDYFGGQSSFEMGMSRDLRKKELFRENGATLIEVRPGYNIEEVIEQIKFYSPNNKTADALNSNR